MKRVGFALLIGFVWLVKHARYYWLLPTEGHLHRRLFDQMPPDLFVAVAKRVRHCCSCKIWD